MPYFSATRRSVTIVNLLMVGREVPVLEHRGELELARRHLVVPRLGRDPELEQLALGCRA